MTKLSPTIESLAGDAWNKFPDNQLIEREKPSIIEMHKQHGTAAIAKTLWDQSPIFHDARSVAHQELGKWMEAVSVALNQETVDPTTLRIHDEAA